MGSQGSGGTLNITYSAEETLKASVSSEGRMNVLLWYRLVGAIAGLLSDCVISTILSREAEMFSCPERQRVVRCVLCVSGPVRSIFCPVRLVCGCPDQSPWTLYWVSPEVSGNAWYGDDSPHLADSAEWRRMR